MKKVVVVLLILVILVGGLYVLRKKVFKAQPTTTAPAAMTDQQQIQAVLEKQVPQRGGVQKFQVIELKFSGDYARATIKPIDVVTDNATVYLQKKNGVWTIIVGPGTGFNPQDPEMKGIPQQLL